MNKFFFRGQLRDHLAIELITEVIKKYEAVTVNKTLAKKAGILEPSSATSGFWEIEGNEYP